MQNILLDHIDKIQKIISIFLFIITIVGLNFLLQPLLQLFFIDEIFLESILIFFVCI